MKKLRVKINKKVKNLEEQGFMSKALSAFNPFKANSSIETKIDQLNKIIQRNQQILNTVATDSVKNTAAQIEDAKFKEITDKAKARVSLKNYSESIAKNLPTIAAIINNLIEDINSNTLTIDRAREGKVAIEKYIKDLEESLKQITTEDQKKKITSLIEQIRKYMQIIGDIVASKSLLQKAMDKRVFLRVIVSISRGSGGLFTVVDSSDVAPFLQFGLGKFVEDDRLKTASQLSKLTAELSTVQQKLQIKEAKRGQTKKGADSSQFKLNPSQQARANQELQQAILNRTGNPQQDQEIDTAVLYKQFNKLLTSLKIDTVTQTVVNTSLKSSLGDEDKEVVLLKYAIFFQAYKDFLTREGIKYNENLLNTIINVAQKLTSKEFASL